MYRIYFYNCSYMEEIQAVCGNSAWEYSDLNYYTRLPLGHLKGRLFCSYSLALGSPEKREAMQARDSKETGSTVVLAV